MEQALAYDLFMDAYESNDTFELKHNSLVTIDDITSLVSQKNIHIIDNLENKNIKNEPNVDFIIEKTKLDFNNEDIYIIKDQNLKNKKSEIYKDLQKGYLKMLSNM